MIVLKNHLKKDSAHNQDSLSSQNLSKNTFNFVVLFYYEGQVFKEVFNGTKKYANLKEELKYHNKIKPYVSFSCLNSNWQFGGYHFSRY